MINRFLHALTNRSKLSDNAMFVSDPNFRPADLTADQRAVRAALQLDNTDTDYYLKTYVALISCFPDIEELTGDFNRSYAIADFLPEGVYSEGGRLVSNQTLSGYYLDVAPTVFPVPITYVVKYIDNQYASLIQVETGASTTTTVTAMTDSVGTLLQVNWPSYWPFRGPVKLDAPWTPGSMLTFKVEPSRFPYAQALSAVTAIPAFQTMLLNQGVTTIFQATVDPMEQLALALAVIAFEHPTLYPQNAGPTGYVDAGQAAAARGYDGGIGVPNDDVYYTVTYVAQEGGTINGTDTQLVQRGSVTTPVTATAIPNSGFVFTGWSDGNTSATRQELKVLQSVTLTANFSQG